jgi:hypothetical protein
MPDWTARFDQATRDLAAAITRRQMLRLLLGAVAAGVAACGRASAQPTPSITNPTPTGTSSPTTSGPASPTSTSPTSPVVLASWCPTDPITDASMEAALAAVAAGQTQVSLSPGGCVALHRAVSSGQVTGQQLLVSNTAVATGTRTAGGVEIAWDYDRDGCPEHRTTVTGAGPAAIRQDTRYDPGTRKPISRATWQPSGPDDRLVEEKADPAGTWMVVGGYSTPGDAGYEATAVGQDGLTVLAQGTACTPEQDAHLRNRLRNAWRTGMSCFDQYKATDLGMDLAFNLAVRDVEFGCSYKDPCEAHLDPASYRDPTAPIHIDVDYGCFTTQLSDYEQAKTLFHELMHVLVGGHNLNNQTYSRYEEADRTTACENLCFGPDPTSKCSCATCLGTTTCDQRCSIHPECDPQLGFACPCPTGPNAGKLFATCAACLARCPSGLSCFGFSTCTAQYRGCGSPPTCP